MTERLARGLSVRQVPRTAWWMMRDPLGSMIHLARAYGDVVEVPVPGHRVFLVGRPEHAEHVLVTHQDNYTKAFTYRLLRVFLGSGPITSEGETWARQRRQAQPIFSRQQVARRAPVMAGAAMRTVRSWEARPDGAIVDVLAAMSGLTLDIVGRALFSADLTGDAPAVLHAVDILQRAALPVARNPVVWMSPRLAALMTPMYWRYARTMRALDSIVARIIAGRAEPQGDLLDVLLGGCPHGDRRQLRDEVMTFLMAGHETTANALAWSLMLLSAHPQARERLEAEVDEVLGGPAEARVPSAADAEALVYTRAVVQESLRLYPPVWTIERDARTADRIGGAHVPTGSTVVVSPYLIHRHPQVWPNPEGFWPERFLPGAAQDRHRYAFIPFGGGRRGCIGSWFALVEAVISLAVISSRYRLDLLPGSRPAPQVAVTLRPDGLPMLLRRR